MLKIFGDTYLTFVILCLCFVIVIGLINVFTKKKGSWSTSLTAPPIPPIKSLNQENQSEGEARARQTLEAYFGLPFSRVRPDFLSNTALGGRNLELDCFNEELKLAVEFNGRQHYEFVPHFHKNIETFHNQKYRDELKRIYCRDNGIYLIEIPYTESRQLEAFLIRRLDAFMKDAMAGK